MAPTKKVKASKKTRLEPKNARKKPAKSRPASKTQSKAAFFPGKAKRSRDCYFASRWYQRFLDYFFIATLIMCAATLTQRIGQGHILGDQGIGASVPSILPIADVLYYVGTVVESYFPLVVACLLAFAAAKRPNAAIALATLASWAGYEGATTALSQYSKVGATGNPVGVDLGILGGILIGFAVAACWSKFRFRKASPWALMISGIPLVIMICATAGVIIGIVVGVLHQLLYLLIVVLLGGLILRLPVAFGSGLYGFLHPLAEVTGLGKLLDIAPQNQYGDCQSPSGEVLHGSYTCFLYSGSQMHGQQAAFLAGGYPVVAFGLTALFIIIWQQIKGKNRQYWALMYWMLIVSLFLAGAEKPALYLLAFAAPALLLIHAIISGIAYSLTTAMGVTIGWAGAPGIIDLVRWARSGDGFWLLAILCVFFTAVYVIFGVLYIRQHARSLNLGGYRIAVVAKPFMGIPLEADKKNMAAAQLPETGQETETNQEPETQEPETDRDTGIEPEESTYDLPESPPEVAETWEEAPFDAAPADSETVSQAPDQPAWEDDASQPAWEDDASQPATSFAEGIDQSPAESMDSESFPGSDVFEEPVENAEGIAASAASQPEGAVEDGEPEEYRESTIPEVPNADAVPPEYEAYPEYVPPAPYGESGSQPGYQAWQPAAEEAAAETYYPSGDTSAPGEGDYTTEVPSAEPAEQWENPEMRRGIPSVPPPTGEYPSGYPGYPNPMAYPGGSVPGAYPDYYPEMPGYGNVPGYPQTGYPVMPGYPGAMMPHYGYQDPRYAAPGNAATPPPQPPVPKAPQPPQSKKPKLRRTES